MFDKLMVKLVPPDLEPQEGVIATKTGDITYKNEVYAELSNAESKNILNGTTPKTFDVGNRHVTHESFTKAAGDNNIPNLQKAFKLDLNIAP
jgi:hypothetical protein